jgi:hypothetical protein
MHDIIRSGETCAREGYHFVVKGRLCQRTPLIQYGSQLEKAKVAVKAGEAGSSAFDRSAETRRRKD